MLAEEIAGRLWPDKTVEIEPLGGGITNHNFKVTVEDEALVLRIGGKDTSLLGIDREDEHGASSAAAEIGVGAEVIDFVRPEGYLVTRFIEGVPIPVEEMRRPKTLVRVAETLRRIHEGPAFPGRFDSFRVVEVYAETAAAHGVRLPGRYEWAHEIASRIEPMRAGTPLQPCHNDLLNANFLDDGERIRIVDWEYAGMGDPFFDLANFSINHELGEDENEAFLAAYFGSNNPVNGAALTLMRFMSDFREAMWGVVQQGISELDVDFVAYADEHFERVERTASDPDFEEALSVLA